MRIRLAVAALAASTFALSCASPVQGRAQTPPVARASPPRCGDPVAGLSFTIRRSTVPDSALIGAKMGGLAVQLLSGRGGRVSPLAGGNVRVYADTMVHAGSPIATGMTETPGAWLSPPLKPALVMVHARAIGYGQLGEQVLVRSGYRDTVEILLQVDHLCLES